MTTRVTDTQVKAIIDTSMTDISLFIETANMIVNEELSDKGMTEARLTKIELYLAAHFITVKERQVLAEKVGESSHSFASTYDIGLSSSLYGQTAIILDTSRNLVNTSLMQATMEIC